MSILHCLLWHQFLREEVAEGPLTSCLSTAALLIVLLLLLLLSNTADAHALRHHPEP
jgi:hypothetical protein